MEITLDQMGSYLNHLLLLVDEDTTALESEGSFKSSMSKAFTTILNAIKKFFRDVLNWINTKLGSLVGKSVVDIEAFEYMQRNIPQIFANWISDINDCMRKIDIKKEEFSGETMEECRMSIQNAREKLNMVEKEIRDRDTENSTYRILKNEDLGMIKKVHSVMDLRCSKIVEDLGAQFLVYEKSEDKDPKTYSLIKNRVNLLCNELSQWIVDSSKCITVLQQKVLYHKDGEPIFTSEGVQGKVIAPTF